jgi:hypothetical protein
MQWFQGNITQIEIASYGDYKLFECVNRSTDTWANLLVTNSKQKFELGWNGKRLSNGNGSKELIAHDPAIHRWVLDTIKQARTEQIVYSGLNKKS